MTNLEKIHGCLAGLALGDSLGCPTEFLSPQQINESYGWVDDFVQALDWHPHAQLPPAHITDDTGQMLAVVQALNNDGYVTAAGVAHHLVLWAEANRTILPLITGPSTRQALDLLAAGVAPEKTGINGTTNGACYRAVIPGLLHYNNLEDLLSQAVEVCRVTHGTTVAISGAVAVAYATAAAMREQATVDAILSAACQGAIVGRKHGAWRWGTPLEKRIQLALDLVRSAADSDQALARLHDQVGVDMLVAESIASAFGVVKLANGDPMKAIQYGANIGGDTDTIAAVAGAICGTLRGIGAIDPEMIAMVELVNRLNLKKVADRLDAIITRRNAHGE